MARIAYSADVNEIRGKIGTNVFSNARSGPTLRIRKSPRNPRTQAQTEVRFYLSKAAVAFRNLTQEQVEAWQDFADTITSHNELTGQTYTPTANTVFVGLASKFLQVNPLGTIPTTPPTGLFLGDTISVTATGDTGVVTFQANTANAANVKTEMLLQRLVNPNRTPNPEGYRSEVFKAFAVGNVDQEIVVTPGWYAPAYRFVNTQTGQQTLLVTLPKVQVL